MDVIIFFGVVPYPHFIHWFILILHINIFFLLFREKTGGITFGDFMEFLSVISKGSNQDKLLWAFTFYDQDKGKFHDLHKK